MKMIRTFLFLVLVCSTSAAESGAIALQATQTNLASGLAFQLRILGRAEKKGDMVIAEATLCNVGYTNLVVPMRDLSIRMELQRPNSLSIPYPDISSMQPRTNAETPLTPGEFFGFRREYRFPMAGVYRIIAVYRPEKTTNMIAIEIKPLTIK